MSVIWKFPIEVTDKQIVTMPFGARILCVQVQNNEPCLWAEVEPMNVPEGVVILTCGTGHPVSTGTYIGTYQLDGGTFVGHVFEGTVRS